MEDGVRGFNPRGGVRRELPGVEVAIKAREVAAGEFEPEAVARGLCCLAPRMEKVLG